MGSRASKLITSEYLRELDVDESIIKFVEDYEMLVNNIKELKGEDKNENIS